MERPLEGIPKDGLPTARERRGPAATSAANGPLGWFLLAAVAALVWAVDQLTKRLVVANLAPMGPGYHVPIIGDWLRLTFTTNTGAAFGLFHNQTLLLTVVAVAAIPLLVFAQSRLPVGGWGAKICVGLLLGGTLGNLSDRIRQGYVVDFIDAGLGDLRWPFFNIADSAFVVGVLLLALYVLLRSESRPPEDAA